MFGNIDYTNVLFLSSDEDTENDDLIQTPACNKKITPGSYTSTNSPKALQNTVAFFLILLVLCFAEHVFALDATDDFLTKRVQGLPQSVAEKMRYTQEEFVPRLTRYRQLSTAEETLLDYFDELEIHPEHIGTVLRAG